MQRIRLSARNTLNARWTPSRAVVWIATALGSLACGDGNETGNAQEFEDINVVRYPGGFGGAPASAESTCSPLADPEALAVDGASRELSWNICHFDAPSLYTLRNGQRAVTEGELESVREVLGRLTPGKAEWMCGADAGFFTLDIRAEASTELYISSLSCPSDSSAGRTPATGIGDLWLKLLALSGE